MSKKLLEERKELLSRLAEINSSLSDEEKIQSFIGQYIKIDRNCYMKVDKVEPDYGDAMFYGTVIDFRFEGCDDSSLKTITFMDDGEKEFCDNEFDNVPILSKEQFDKMVRDRVTQILDKI
ncbi:hypothetical protein [Intestinibacter sp.]|uniref:hypothetical protein n=1 Tax=Intestinibacter sp. TaxID=1965304 RepID=UPI003F17A949